MKKSGGLDGSAEKRVFGDIKLLQDLAASLDLELLPRRVQHENALRAVLLDVKGGVHEGKKGKGVEHEYGFIFREGNKKRTMSTSTGWSGLGEGAGDVFYT